LTGVENIMKRRRCEETAGGKYKVQEMDTKKILRNFVLTVLRHHNINNLVESITLLTSLEYK